MSVYAVTYQYVDDAEALARYRAEHRAFLADLLEQGILRLSGPVEGGRALLVFVADSAEHVASLLDEDPFRRQGLIVQRDVAAWDVVYGADLLA